MKRSPALLEALSKKNEHSYDECGFHLTSGYFCLESGNVL